VNRGSRDLARGLELLREVMNGPTPEPDPVEQLAALAKTFDPAREEELIAKRLDVLDQVLDRAARRQPERRRERPTIGKTLAELELVVSPVDRVLAIAKNVDVTAMAIQGQPRPEPPDLHHTSGTRNCANCRFWTARESDDATTTAIQGHMGAYSGSAGVCSRYKWPVDPDEVCESWAAA
jgi:hypothetical protein